MSKKKESRKNQVPAIPQLSLKALDDVQKIERYARQQLRECENLSHLNIQKAERILRTCTVQVLKTQITYYESVPAFHEKWIIKLQEDAIGSAVGMIQDGYGNDVYEHFREVLWKTTYADLNPPTLKPKPVPKVMDRKTLRQSYLRNFPETKILDICWAAKQRYREWKRWLKHEVKDGSTPDRAFRAVLTSGKRPAEVRDERRPSGWQ
jgi:hypothetical protein